MFTKKDWLVLIIAGLVGMVIIGLPIFFLTSVLIKGFTSNKDYLSSFSSDVFSGTGMVRDAWSERLTQSKLIAERGNALEVFEKGTKNSLIKFLKQQKIDESFGMSNFSYLYNGKTEARASLDLSDALISLEDLPEIDYQVYVYTDKRVCSVDVIYFDTTGSVTGYYTGYTSECTPTLGG
jgi:hypothetical protein